MKDVAPEDGSLYDVSQRRIGDIRNAGRANTCSNLLKYILQTTVMGRVFRLSALSFSGGSWRRWDLST